jgi:hypothetical protein
MSTRPQSLNDEMPIAKRIRRDQFRRVGSIIDANCQFPIIALGLVRDYFKGNPDIRAIYFDDQENPKTIIVHTAASGGLEGTEYHYALKKDQRLETPTL